MKNPLLNSENFILDLMFVHEISYLKFNFHKYQLQKTYDDKNHLAIRKVKKLILLQNLDH